METATAPTDDEVRTAIETLLTTLREPRIEVRSEPLTYHRHGTNSYFRDLALGANGNMESAARISRHTQEMRIEQAAQETRARRTLDANGFEVRTEATSVTSDFAVPLWLNQFFATGRRTARVLGDLVPTFPLPVGAHSINLPRIVTANIVQPQQDASAVPDQDVTDAGVTATVTTFAGQGDVSLQLLEQSPAGAHLDWAFFKDLTEAYDQQVEYQLLFGSGVGENFAGITTLAPSSNQVTYTATSPTLYGMYPYIGQVAAQIGDNRERPPEVWLMTTSRWAQIATALDNQNRPIVTPDVHPPDPEPDGPEAVSTLLGWPVLVDDVIPRTLGAGANQDLIIACRPSDLILLEGSPRTSVYLEVLSGVLSARIQLRNYAAALTGRYPTGIGTLGGTGLVVSSGF